MTLAHKTRTRQRLNRVVRDKNVRRQLHLLFELVELLERDDGRPDCPRLTYGMHTNMPGCPKSMISL